MTNQTKEFNLYLQVRIGALFGDDVRLTTCLDGREVTIRASDGAQPMSEAEWLVFEARRFPTEPEARTFGERLGANVELAAFCSGLGVDTGPDEVFGSINGEDRQSEGRPKPHPRYGPGVHGLLIRPDDYKPAGAGIRAAITAASDPMIFLGAMRELADQPSITEHVIAPVRLLNLARITSQPLARIVLAISAVESVAAERDAEGKKWSTKQRKSIKNLAEKITDPEVSRAVKNVQKSSVAKSVERLLCCIGLGRFRKEWKRIYKLRSTLLHGGKKRWQGPEIGKLASDATQLCRKIIFATMKRDGIPLPSVASVNFKDI